MKYSHKQKSRKMRGRTIAEIVIGIIFIITVIATVGTRYWYDQQLKPLTKQSLVVVTTIPEGYSSKQIGNLLQKNHIIRSATAFNWYVTDNNLRDSLMAGRYALNSSDSTITIASDIATGKIQKKLFTILPGQRLDQIKAALINYGFKPADVNAALNPSNYTNSPALVSKPSNASLEGYLYPDSYQTTSSTSPSDIITESLQEMSNALTPQMVSQFQKQGLDINQAVTLASIVEQEVSNPIDRQMVAGVFLNRLKAGMSLGSDVTDQYASILAGLKQPDPNLDSPYNTLISTGIPPGPISNVSASSLNAIANPIQSDYLYFVTGDNGITYYAATLQEHDAQAQQYCHTLCSNY